MEKESVDLIYLDPPFFSNRNYEVIWGDTGEIRSFQDRWATFGSIEYQLPENPALRYLFSEFVCYVLPAVRGDMQTFAECKNFFYSNNSWLV